MRTERAPLPHATPNAARAAHGSFAGGSSRPATKSPPRTILVDGADDDAGVDDAIGASIVAMAIALATCSAPPAQLDDSDDEGEQSLNGFSEDMVIDFTRYDLPAHEPKTLQREWSLMNVINQKGTRPEDRPVRLGQLSAENQRIIYSRYPELKKLA